MERRTTSTLDLRPLRRRAVVLVSAVVLVALALSVVLVPLVILPAVILLLSLALAIFVLFLDFATIALVTVTLPSLLSPLFTRRRRPLSLPSACLAMAQVVPQMPE